MKKIPVSSCHGLAAGRRQRWRNLRDRLARHGIALGGLGVLMAIVLIFFYLAWVIYPLFVPASIERSDGYIRPMAALGPSLALAIEEQNRIGMRLTRDGSMVFFRVSDGRVVRRERLPLPKGRRIVAVAESDPATRVLAVGLDDGHVIIVRHDYRADYSARRKDANGRMLAVIRPQLVWPAGRRPLLLDERGARITQLAVQADDEGLSVVGLTADGRLVMVSAELDEGVMEEDAELTRANLKMRVPADFMLLDKERRFLYLASRDGRLWQFDVSDREAIEPGQRLRLTGSGERLTALRFLAGDVSLMAGTSHGRVTQWFNVRDKGNRERLRRIREFRAGEGAVLYLQAEPARKGFVTVTGDGRLTMFHATAQRQVLQRRIAVRPPLRLAISPRHNGLLIEDARGMRFWRVDNEHPEVSWSSIWGKVWYEGYQKPAYVWQSSSASNDFEPKFSLTPLVFGTLKAAFYAMLFAIPLAIMGAIYTAYFMSPKMRRLVKPTIEIMEALPTVILGFLAGLWLAPAIERNLPGVFALLLLLPLAVLVFGWFWHRLPSRIRHRVPDGWQAALVIPVIAITVWAAIGVSQPLENALFDGDMRHWLKDALGLDFDQRNAMVVGFAMGFAVIPTIFSIAEDAIFSVPKSLSFGSLALGATPWQTLTRVVLLTASPGIFSAVMMGLGRAVGETMIVLMATGNTPVMDMNIFEGMRTLSANIAVEMPESEVASTHFRVLFLAAFVLFVFTFLFNTLAEIVRQRLRRKYSAL